MKYRHLDIVLEEIKSFTNTYQINDMLEIGPGLNSFEKYFKTKNYTCIDNESEYKGKSIKLDVHDMKYENKFDCVFMSHCAEHFVNPMLAWKNIYKSLKKGGIVISFTPYPCEHQIMKGDKNHIFVLNNFQWIRILSNSKFKNIRSYTKKIYNNQQIPHEQDYCVITVGEK